MELSAWVKDILEGSKQIFPKQISTIDILSLILTFCSGLYILIYKYLLAKNKAKARADLHPYLTDDDITAATKYYISTQCQDRPIEIEDELIEGIGIANKSKLISFFLKEFKSNNKRIYLILGDAGMGKTTFMVNLFLKYNKRLFQPKLKMKFIPLGDRDALDQIKELQKSQSDTILLLDALEEDRLITTTDWHQRINEIIQNVLKFKKVIITCRTQFFPNEEREKFTLEVITYGGTPRSHKANKKYICPFTDKEVKKYLNRKYGRSYVIDEKIFYTNPKRIHAKNLVNMAPSLTVRPMLLDKVDILLNNHTYYKYEFQIYRELVHLWILREADKPGISDVNEFYSHMSTFLDISAETIYQNFRSGYGLFITEEQITSIAEKNSIVLNSIQMKSKSLLNRNPRGDIKFSHKTILEYFLAKKDFGSPYLKINFDTFDFALKMKEQMLVEKLQTNRLNILANIGNSHFRAMSLLDGINKIKAIDMIIVNNDPIFVELSYFRIFSQLKRLYILRLLPQKAGRQISGLNLTQETENGLLKLFVRFADNDFLETIFVKVQWRGLKDFEFDIKRVGLEELVEV